MRPVVAIAWGIALAALAAVLVLARQAILLGFVAVLIAVAFGFPAAWLSRLLPRSVSVVITLLVLLALLAGLGFLTWPVVSRQAGVLTEQLPKGVRIAQEWLQGRRGGPVAALPPDQKRQVKEKVQERVGDMVASGVTRTLPLAKSVAEGAITAVLVLILAAFLAAQPDVYRRGVRRLVAPRLQPLFDEAWSRVARDLRRWVGGIAVSMLLMGAFTTAGLAIAGVDGWLLLGVLTLLATSVPYLGAITSAIPGLIVALGEGMPMFFAALGVYLGVHIVEGYVVQPLIMKRAVELRPALVLFGQAFFGAAFGVLGVVVATPLLVCIRTLVDVLWVERIAKEAAPPEPS